jgi:copper chaperone CopZ
MKTLKILFLLLLAATVTNAQFKSARLQAAGLTCAMCTKAINESLNQVAFIQDIDVDIKNSEFILSFKPGADVDPDVLKKAVEDAGFSVARLKLTGNFSNVKIEKDAHVSIEGKTFHFLNGNSQTLNGEKTITVVDKYFVPAKDFKKYASSTSMSCVQTGKAASCCVKESAAQNSRIYHVII